MSPGQGWCDVCSHHTMSLGRGPRTRWTLTSKMQERLRKPLRVAGGSSLTSVTSCDAAVGTSH